jgi:hypothetical protein
MLFSCKNAICIGKILNGSTNIMLVFLWLVELYLTFSFFLLFSFSIQLIRVISQNYMSMAIPHLFCSMSVNGSTIHPVTWGPNLKDILNSLSYSQVPCPYGAMSFQVSPKYISSSCWPVMTPSVKLLLILFQFEPLCSL